MFDGFWIRSGLDHVFEALQMDVKMLGLRLLYSMNILLGSGMKWFQATDAAFLRFYH